MDKRGVKNLKWIGDEAISFVAYTYDPLVETSRVLKREVGVKGTPFWRIRQRKQ